MRDGARFKQKAIDRNTLNVHINQAGGSEADKTTEEAALCE